MKLGELLKESQLITYLKNGSKHEALKLIKKHNEGRPENLGVIEKDGQQDIVIKSERGFFQFGADPNQGIYFNLTKNPDTDIFLQDKKYRTALHIAAEKGYDEVIVALLEKGFDVNIKDGSGMSALHYAAGSGRMSTIKLLVSKNANPNSTDQIKFRPYDKLPLGNYTANDLSYLLYGVEISKMPARNDFQRHLNELNINYCILLRKPVVDTLNGKKNRDSEFLNIALNISIALQAFCKNPEDIAKHKDELNSAFSMLSTCITNITYDLIKDHYHLLPWRNIETLRSLFFYANNSKHDFFSTAAQLIQNNLQEFIFQAVPHVIAGLQAVLANKEKWYKKGTGTAEMPASAWIKGLEPLYHMTEPLIDLRSLDELLLLVDQAGIIADAPASKQKSHALLGILKRIGEFSKYAQMSRNLSNPIKDQFTAIPWVDLSDLRNQIAKAVETPSKLPQYLSIIEGNAEQPFKDLKTELIHFKEQIKEVKAKHLAMLNDQNAKAKVVACYAEEKQDIDSNVRLTPAAEQELISDLQGSIIKCQADLDKVKKDKNDKKAQLENRGKSFGADHEKRMDDNIAECAQKLENKIHEIDLLCGKVTSKKITKSTLEKIRNHLGKDAQKKWSVEFEGNTVNRLNNMSKFLLLLKQKDLSHDFYNKLKLENPGVDNNLSLALCFILRLQEMLIPDESILKAIKNDQKLIRDNATSREVIYIRDMQEVFQSDLTLRMAVEHVFSDLFTLLELSNIHSNKGLRNQIEHQNNIFNTAEVDLSLGNFHEFIGIAIDTESQITDAIKICKAQLRAEFDVAKSYVQSGNISELQSLDLSMIINFQEENTSKTLAHYCTDRKELTEKASIIFDDKLCENRVAIFKYLISRGCDLSLKNIGNNTIEDVIDKNLPRAGLDKTLAELLQKALPNSATKSPASNPAYKTASSSASSSSSSSASSTIVAKLT
ncbi:MAG: ankyrin repeat domain-containing protein [Legionellales bacterium]|jgi:uncharacterized protein with HEPN domain